MCKFISNDQICGFYSYSAGIDFSRQNQILTPEVDPRTVRINIFLMAVHP